MVISPATRAGGSILPDPVVAARVRGIIVGRLAPTAVAFPTSDTRMDASVRADRTFCGTWADRSPGFNGPFA